MEGRTRKWTMKMCTVKLLWNKIKQNKYGSSSSSIWHFDTGDRNLNALVPTTATHGQSQEKHSTQNEVEQKED